MPFLTASASFYQYGALSLSLSQRVSGPSGGDARNTGPLGGGEELTELREASERW
jgi:hypothetical protein